MKFDDIDAFVFDFVGVLTDNLVYLDQNGKETVVCNRSDGIAFDVLRKLNKPSYIVSTEKNPVVTARAKKLNIKAYQAIEDKVMAVNDLAIKYGHDVEKLCYVGNDVNDYKAMKYCGFSACPSDSHSSVIDIADIVLISKGGQGVLRELLEDHFNINFIKTLYSE